jgi:hypothetical protein
LVGNSLAEDTLAEDNLFEETPVEETPAKKPHCEALAPLGMREFDFTKLAAQRGLEPRTK